MLTPPFLYSNTEPSLLRLTLYTHEPNLVYPNVVPVERIMPEVLVIASPDQTLVVIPGDE